jgi:hypothetical protein
LTLAGADRAEATTCRWEFSKRTTWRQSSSFCGLSQTLSQRLDFGDDQVSSCALLFIAKLSCSGRWAVFLVLVSSLLKYFSCNGDSVRGRRSVSGGYGAGLALCGPGAAVRRGRAAGSSQGWFCKLCAFYCHCRCPKRFSRAWGCRCCASRFRSGPDSTLVSARRSSLSTAASCPLSSATAPRTSSSCRATRSNSTLHMPEVRRQKPLFV